MKRIKTTKMQNIKETRRAFIRKAGLGVVAIPFFVMLSCQMDGSKKSNNARGNILDYGAVGDGKFLNTAAIQKTIDEVAESGGGKVTIPTGTFLSGSIVLKSNITLYLEQGAKLVASKDYNDFVSTGWTPIVGDDIPEGKSTFHFTTVFRKERRAFIIADSVSNCAIEGDGVIDGGHNFPIEWPFDAKRTQLIFIRDSYNINISNLTLAFAENWSIHMVNCEGVNIHGLTIKNSRERITTDGIDIDGCRQVVISDCNIYAGDDCIVLRSSEGHLCENIVVTNCIMTTTCAGIVIGSCATGDIRNATFSNCIIKETGRPLQLKSYEGATYENISFSNIIMDECGGINITMHPLHDKESNMGIIRNISFNGLFYTGNGRIYMEAVEGYPLENISFSNVNWKMTQKLKEKAGLPRGGPHAVHSADLSDEEFYQHSWQPNYIVAAHVRGLQLANIQIHPFEEEDASNLKALYMYNVEGENISNLKLNSN